jgi:hypothetical protein
MNTFKKIKTITSHVGLSRWLAEVDQQPTGYLARVQCEEIPSPYAYSPVKFILNWNGREVIEFETSHRRYEVFEVPSNMLRFKTEEEATDWNTRFSKH